MVYFSGQHGFRKGHSCESALHELLSYINVAKDQCKIVMLFFIDFRKAFDTVDTNLLLLKLLHYGFDNQSLRLLTSYFNNRRQVVKQFDDCNPDIRCTPKLVNLGVPQGSCLGPFLFLVFINDLPFLLTLLAKLFADDTTLYLIGDDIDALILDFNRRALAVFDWCNVNRLDINCS